jgi:hypothetical protein
MLYKPDQGEDALRMRILIKQLIAWIAPLQLIAGLWHFLAAGIWHYRGVPFPTLVSTLQRLVPVLMGEQIMDNSVYRHAVDSPDRGQTAGSCFRTRPFSPGSLRRRTSPSA